MSDPRSCTPEEALAEVRALCDSKGLPGTLPVRNRSISQDEVRAVLDRVQPTPPAGIDPEALAQRFHEAYERLAPSFGYETRRESAVPWEDVPEANRRLMTAVASEVLAEVQPAPPAGIDRDALIRLLEPMLRAGWHADEEADRVLALVRPVGGVWLTPDERALIVDTLRDIPDMDLRMAQIRPSRQAEVDERRALAARLEEAGE